jgi:hypothetical protein
VLDQVTSNTAALLPVVAMAALAKQRTPALVVVDAAHALFALPAQLYGTRFGSESGSGREAHSKEQQEQVAVRVLVGSSSENSRDGVPNSGDITAPATTPPPAVAAADTVDAGGLHLADVADVWLTNGHKWLGAPKGCAFMWVHPTVAGHLRPAVLSHGFQPFQPFQPFSPSSSSRSGGEGDVFSRGMRQGGDVAVRWTHAGTMTSSPSASSCGSSVSGSSKFLSSIVWDGCRDYSALLCAPLALRVWSMVEEAHAHRSVQVRQQGELLCDVCQIIFSRFPLCMCD